MSPAWILPAERQLEVPAVAWIGIGLFHLVNFVVARRAAMGARRPRSSIGRSILLILGGVFGALVLAGLVRMVWTFHASQPIIHLDALAGALWQLALPGLMLGWSAGLDDPA